MLVQQLLLPPRQILHKVSESCQAQAAQWYPCFLWKRKKLCGSQGFCIYNICIAPPVRLCLCLDGVGSNQIHKSRRPSTGLLGATNNWWLSSGQGSDGSGTATVAPNGYLGLPSGLYIFHFILLVFSCPHPPCIIEIQNSALDKYLVSRLEN